MGRGGGLLRAGAGQKSPAKSDFSHQPKFPVTRGRARGNGDVRNVICWLMMLGLGGGSAFGGDQQTVEASPKDGFHQAYILVLPARLTEGAPFLVATPTPQTSTNAQDFVAAAERIAMNAGRVAGELGLAVLVPVLPRPPVRVGEDKYINLYVPSLSRAALLEREEKLARMDLQTLAMLDHARGKVQAERGVRTDSRAIFAGFSAAGHFATRMAVLHPKRVLAVWAGGVGGHPIAPQSKVGGRILTYPVGVGDLKEIVGAEFDAEAYSKISMMLIHGAEDMNSALPADSRPSDSYTFEQALMVSELFGATATERLEKIRKAHEDAGARVEVKIYPEAGHHMSPEIVADLSAFIGRQASAAVSQKESGR